VPFLYAQPLQPRAGAGAAAWREARLMATDRFRLDGKAAVVTGGANGLGLAAVAALQAAGARVAVLDLAATDAGEFQVQADVTDEAQIEAAFAAVAERF